MNDTPTANAEQSARWNERTGRTWAELSDMLDRLLEPFVPLLLDEVGPVAGRRMLDVGCGAGALTLAAAEQGASGLGVDISGPLIEAARARTGRVAGADFVQADAQTHRFEPRSFDALVSRFGVMFFADPPAAFENLRGAVRPGGKLACAAWRSAAENAFMTAAGRAAAGILPQLAGPVDDGPGQFGFADPDRVRAIFAESGWKDFAIRPIDMDCSMSGDDLRLYARRMGPVADLLPSLDDDTRSEVERLLDEAFLPFLAGGEARFTAACWMVTARA